MREVCEILSPTCTLGSRTDVPRSAVCTPRYKLSRKPSYFSTGTVLLARFPCVCQGMHSGEPEIPVSSSPTELDMIGDPQLDTHSSQIAHTQLTELSSSTYTQLLCELSPDTTGTEQELGMKLLDISQGKRRYPQIYRS